jgi:D-alanine-D-alanine ligase-like ATP-grasp enzyme
MGSRSRHTTTHIQTAEELISAFQRAKVLCPWVIVEEEEVGFVYRGTVIGGQLVAVLRREPPMVVGDGTHTIAELVAIENKNPLRDGKVFHKITIGEEARAELARQNLTLASVVRKGHIVTFSQKASRGIGGGTTDVTDFIHSDNRAMLEDAAQVVGDPLMGIDFILPDITKSWKTQERCGIIESNSMPFIDLHHYPLVGTPRNVAGALWDLVYPASRES